MPGVITNDQLDFHYLVTKYGIDGARTHFESICVELMQRKYGTRAHGIRVTQGDGGIDVMVGDFSAPIQVFQCKFFLEKTPGVKNSDILDSSRRNQICSSFRTARKNQTFSMSKWSLCLPCVLSEDEMEWWSDWKADMEEDHGVPIELCDGDYLITELKKYGLYDQIFDIQLSNTLDELKRKMDALLASSSKSDNHLEHVTRIASLIDSASVAEAQQKFTPIDAEKFYLVDTNFQLMLRVVSGDGDVIHKDINKRLAEILSDGAPAILTGNSGCGKSTIMLRAAVDWVRQENMALWVRFSETSPITDGAARDFYASLLKIIPDGQKALLCLDNPSEHTDSFRALAKHWPDDSRIQLMLAERGNRLSRLADSSRDHLHHWFDQAEVVTMRHFQLKDYHTTYLPEGKSRRELILQKVIPVLVRRGGVRISDLRSTIQAILYDYRKFDISLVELIYRTQFRLRDFASNPEQIRMDWDEWKTILRRELDCKRSARDLYGVIALCSVFETPMTVDLFCRMYGLDRCDLLQAIQSWRIRKHVEPVMYDEHSDTLLPKHDVAAELFFLFHRENLDHNAMMERIITSMKPWELDSLLEKMVFKKAIQSRSRGNLKGINYRRFFMTIYDRRDSLYTESRTRLGLGLLYSVPKQDREIWRLLDGLDVSIAPDRLTASFYTEWGILAARRNDNRLAEEKFRLVADHCPTQLPARTELGRLLMKLGRYTEAETVLREIIQIHPNDIQSRTELGRLLMKLGRHEDAETVLREILAIDHDNIQARTELGRLFMKLGRDDEAIDILREAVRIDHKNIHPHTELGRLLMKLGRYTDAEPYFRKAIELDNNQVAPRTELGRLLMKLDRYDEAETVLREILAIDHDNIHTRTELGRLLMKLGRHADAEDVLQTILRLDANNLHARIQLAELRIQSGHSEQARELYREVLRLNPGNPYATKGLAKLHNP